MSHVAVGGVNVAFRTQKENKEECELSNYTGGEMREGE